MKTSTQNNRVATRKTDSTSTETQWTATMASEDTQGSTTRGMSPAERVEEFIERTKAVDPAFWAEVTENGTDMEGAQLAYEVAFEEDARFADEAFHSKQDAFCIGWAFGAAEATANKGGQ